MGKRYHGIDLHASKLTMHTIQGEGENCQRSTKSLYTATLETDLFPILTSEDMICVEASTCTAWFVGEVRKTGAQVIVINPYDFKALYCTGKKTDKVDAKKLAEFVCRRDSVPSGCMEEVSVPERKDQALRKSITLYKHVSKMIVSCQNQLLSIFRSKCISITYATFKADKDTYYGHHRLDENDRSCIDRLEETIEHLKGKKATLYEVICTQGATAHKNELSKLITIPGISVFGASCIMADIVDIGRFRTAKKLCSYLSSAPKVDASNTSVRIRGINKHGRKIAYWVILQGINHMIDSNPNLKRFYEKKLLGKASCKVRAGAVRRIMTTIFYILRNDEPYRYSQGPALRNKARQLEKYSQAA